MKYYVNISGDLFAFSKDGSQNEYITDDMILITESNFDKIQYRPSKYHAFDIKKMDWTISKKSEAILEAENKKKDEDEFRSKLRKIRVDCDAEIAPLQDAFDLEVATKEEIDTLKKLKMYRVALSRWSYPDPIPEL